MAEYTPTTDDRLCDTITDYADDFLRPDHQRETRWEQVEEAIAAHDRAVKAEGWDEGYARAKSSHCDASPSAAYCDVTDNNPHRADQIEGATE